MKNSHYVHMCIYVMYICYVMYIRVFMWCSYVYLCDVYMLCDVHMCIYVMYIRVHMCIYVMYICVYLCYVNTKMQQDKQHFLDPVKQYQCYHNLISKLNNSNTNYDTCLYYGHTCMLNFTIYARSRWHLWHLNLIDNDWKHFW